VAWHIQIHGGRQPYHITWEWGDGASDTTTADGAGAASNSHTYSKSGIYHVVIRARDASGREAVMTVLAIINGSSAGGLTRPVEPPGNMVFIWPLLIMASLMVLSFWLGERHKLSVVALRPQSGANT